VPLMTELTRTTRSSSLRERAGSEPAISIGHVPVDKVAVDARRGLSVSLFPHLPEAPFLFLPLFAFS
jgi:hypothetical protein